jgi:hypothetical protein
MEPVKRLGVLLAIGAALLLAGGWLGMPAAQAQERCWEKHIADPPQDFSKFRRVCEGDIQPTPGPGPIPGPEPGPRPQPTPPPCPNPTEIIVSGPHYDEDRSRCFVIVQVINLCTNTPMGDPFTRYVECPKPTPSNPCVDPNGNPLFAIGPGGIFCGRDGGLTTAGDFIIIHFSHEALGLGSSAGDQLYHRLAVVSGGEAPCPCSPIAYWDNLGRSASPRRRHGALRPSVLR